MRLKKYQEYLFLLFVKRFILTSLVFFSAVVLVNVFEEINFMEKYDTNLYYVLYLSLLNSPSLIFEIFPFIFLISVKLFYLNLLKKMN